VAWPLVPLSPKNTCGATFQVAWGKPPLFCGIYLVFFRFFFHPWTTKTVFSPLGNRLWIFLFQSPTMKKPPSGPSYCTFLKEPGGHNFFFTRTRLSDLDFWKTLLFAPTFPRGGFSKVFFFFTIFVPPPPFRGFFFPLPLFTKFPLAS